MRLKLSGTDDELEDDFEAIQSQVLHHDIQETTFEIKSRISSVDYKDKVSKMLSTFNREIFMRLIFVWSSLLRMRTINPLINSLN
jgi:hypothetical protein